MKTHFRKAQNVPLENSPLGCDYLMNILGLEIRRRKKTPIQNKKNKKGRGQLGPEQIKTRVDIENESMRVDREGNQYFRLHGYMDLDKFNLIVKPYNRDRVTWAMNHSGAWFSYLYLDAYEENHNILYKSGELHKLE